MINGKIQLDEDSLFLNQDPSDSKAASMEIIDESIGRRVTSATFRRSPTEKFSWNERNTAIFYQVEFHFFQS